jgi:hypothetical protein
LQLSSSSFCAAGPGSGFHKEQHAIEEFFALGGVRSAREFFAKLTQSL